MQQTGGVEPQPPVAAVLKGDWPAGCTLQSQVRPTGGKCAQFRCDVPILPQGLVKMKDLLQKNIQTGVEFANKA